MQSSFWSALDQESTVKVWKAEYQGKPAAAKITTCPVGFRPSELAILQRAQGKHTVRLLGVEEGTPKGTAIVMELCQGNLHDWLKQLKAQGTLLRGRAFLNHLEQILEGLVALHEQGLVYGDLKPDNIMIDNEGQYRFTDFGDGRDVQDAQEAFMSIHELGWGSPMYHAKPDVIRQKITFASDMWMFAQTAIHLWTHEEAKSNPAPLPADILLDGILKSCFSDDSSQRPSASAALHECRLLMKQLESGIMREQSTDQYLPDIARHEFTGVMHVGGGVDWQHGWISSGPSRRPADAYDHPQI